MATNAILLKDLVIVPGNDDGMVKIFEGECQGVVPAVTAFCEQFGDQTVRQMAVITGRYVVVPRIAPGVVLVIHDMAVHAGFRVR